MRAEIWIVVDWNLRELFCHGNVRCYLLREDLSHSFKVKCFVFNSSKTLSKRIFIRSRNSVRRHNISSSGEEEDNANARLLKMLVTTTVAYILGFVGPLIIGLVEYFSGRQGQKSAGM